MTNKKIRVQDATDRASVENREEVRKDDRAKGKKKKSKKTRNKKQEEAADNSSEPRMKW